MGPATDTPHDWKPHRPRSWTVVNKPGVMTRSSLSLTTSPVRGWNPSWQARQPFDGIRSVGLDAGG